MTFARPEMLWLLAAIAPLLAGFLLWSWRKRVALIREFVQSRLLAQLTVGVSRRRQQLRLLLLAAGVVLLLLALARPQYGFAWEEVRQRGLDILVAVDTSRSMLATDVSPSRLARAKLAALDLMRAAQSDRLGLVAFAGTAFLQCPLTLDDSAFSQSVGTLDPTIIPQGGTALAEAIQTAISAFKESGENYKVLLILTDGEDHESGVLEAAEKAAAAGVRIYTIGIGTLEGDRVRAVDETGKTTYLTDLDGKQVVSKLNQDLLQQIATTTQGDYLSLRGPDPMKLLYDARLAPLPKSDLATRLFRQYYERFQWPLGLAFLCLAAELFINERRRVPRPRGTPPVANAGVRMAAGAIVAVLFAHPIEARADKAERAYDAGRFTVAQREYERLIEKKPDDPRLRYNAGAAAYKAGRFDQAADAWRQAILSSDPDLLAQAYYNLGNSLYRLGERAASPDETSAHWEQAIQSYDSALKLAPEDADARFNREWVQRKLEELRQQQQQQQQKDQQQDQQNPHDKKDQQNQQGQQNQEHQEDEQNQRQDSQSQPDAKQDGAQPPKPQPQQQDSQGSEQQPQPQPGEKPQEQQAERGSPDKKEPPEAKPRPGNEFDKGQRDPQEPTGEGAAAPMGQMTPEQARAVLETARTEERPMIFVPPPEPRSRARYRKEW
ncbi:MAG TPA: VWA domain-containing protein [Verrucomicrobiota bacterium]|nr:VWA domain-containing protein [Verrucomicrobiota bacterium]HNU52939.1 VWA domain-containing protein [Verrucomicrobiota bacterium]